MKPKYFITGCFFLLIANCFSQQADVNDTYLRAAFNYGVIVQQHNNIGQLVKGNIWGLEFNYVKPTSGNKSWHERTHYPERGVGFSYFNLDNPKQLGDLYALYFFYDIPLRKKATLFRLYLRTCEGLALTPVHFDPITNHQNNVISSPINAYVNLKFYYRWNIGKHFRWEAGVNFSHASNGRFEQPNLGINMLTFNTSIVYKILPKEKTPITKVDSSTDNKSKNEILAWSGFGLNEVGMPLGKKYFAQSYSVSYYRNLSNTSRLGLGLDVSYNAASYHDLKQDSSVHISSKFQNIQLGVKIAYAYNIGRFSLPVEMGYYVYSMDKSGMIFHRIGMRYYFDNNMVAVITLKTQWAIANYFEFGFGYRFPFKAQART
jgi:hypothetical protein